MLFLLVLPVHIYMMRQKLKKLSEQLVSLAATGEATSSCASMLLPNALHHKSIREFSYFLGLDPHKIGVKLNEACIQVKDLDSSIQAIALNNQTDPMKIFSIMLQKEATNPYLPVLYADKSPVIA